MKEENIFMKSFVTFSIVIVLAVILFFGGYYFFIPPVKYWYRSPVNFEECKEANRRFVFKTKPAKCQWGEGVFVEGVDVEVPPRDNTSAQLEELDISTWKTYRNEKYGFEVKYPVYFQEGRGSNYEGDKIGNNEEEDFLLFLNPADKRRYAETMTISIVLRAFEKYKFIDPFQEIEVAPEKTTVGETVIYAVSGVDILCWEYNYYVPKDLFMVKIAFNDCGEDHRTVAPKTEILSTIKFIK